MELGDGSAGMGGPVGNRGFSSRARTMVVVLITLCSMLLGLFGLKLPNAVGEQATSLIMLTPVVQREPGEWAYLHVQALNASGYPVSGVSLDWDLRGSIDNNYQHLTTFSTPPTGSDGMATIAYTWTNGGSSEDIINVHPPGVITGHPNMQAVAQVSFVSGANTGAPIWPVATT